MYREKLRITMVEVMEFPEPNLMCMVVGKGILNNPNIIRMDDIKTGDIVFYEKIK